MKMDKLHLFGILAILMIVVSNILTHISASRPNKALVKTLEKQIDSLKALNAIANQKLLHEVRYRQSLHRADSALIASINKDAKKDDILIAAQKEALNKYKNMNSHELLKELDKLYEDPSNH